jgi:3'-5' exoribonuclease
VATLPVVPLHQLVPNVPAACFALLADKQTRTTRDGSPYLVVTWKDRQKSLSSTIWSDSPLFEIARDEWSAGGFYRLQGVLFNTDKYGPQFELRDGRDVRPRDEKDGFREIDLIARSRFESAVMFDELMSLVMAELKSGPVRQLVASILTTHRFALERLPASKDRYHTVPGGWLEHTLTVSKTCLWLTDFYARHRTEQPLNRDLVLAAASLHEIGRVAEWKPPSETGLAPERTIPGQLHGNLILARDLIRDAAVAIPELDGEFLVLLEHLVLSYLTLPEWGSPRLPAIPEVLILHHADDLDAKLEMYARCLAGDSSAGPFTDPDPVLKRPLLKRRSDLTPKEV